MACHGVLDEERHTPQPFDIDIELRLPPPPADCLDLTVDYAQLAADVSAIVQSEPVNLIETLANRIAGACLTGPAESVTVTVHKPQAPIEQPFADVSCTIEAARFALSLGANIGDTLETLASAVATLAKTPGIRVSDVSSIYQTTPVELLGQQGIDSDRQPDYHNLVVTGVTTLTPTQLLGRTAAIETGFGRQRPYRFAPRTLDIDLIVVGDAVLDTPQLTLPHPRAAERAFVLVPWIEIAPNAELPAGRAADLVERLDTSGVHLLGPLSVDI